MEPLEFLSAVLPTAGVYCVAELSSAKKEHVFVDSVEAAHNAAELLGVRKRDVYFALASFLEPGRRTVENALYVRAAFMDIDCGPNKAYPSKKAAALALQDFLETTALGRLGTPWIVSSGGGLHVYWPFTENQPIDAWRPVAENLKRLAKAHGLNIDMTVTADAARVLRVPGTTNWKLKDTPRPVEIRTVSEAFRFEDFAQAVREKLNGSAYEPATTLNLPGKAPKRIETAASIKLAVDSSTAFKTILDRTVAGTGCGQLAHYLLHAAEDGTEPLWRGLLSIVKVCSDADKYVGKLSDLHPYAPDRTAQKLREIKGPYACTKLDSENPGVCPSCPHWGKITNPLALGRELQTDNAEREITVSEPDAATPIVLTRPEPPKGFVYGRSGGVYAVKTSLDAEGIEVPSNVMVVPYDFFALDILNTNGEHTVHMLAMRPEGPSQITFPQKVVVSKDETVKALASQNIIAVYGAGNDKNLYDYVRACTERMSSDKKSIRVPSSCGWQDDETFVYSGKIYSGVEATPVPMPGLENITANTAPTGSLDGWRAVMNLLVKKELWDILALSMVGFGAPLMRYTGLNGLTFHLGSTESATGKTLTLQLAASVWGHPDHYRVQVGTSDVAMQQRLGLLRNLPLITDEITSKNRKDFEWFPGFLLSMTEGRGKERMESGANKERLNLSTWSSLALMSSNTHVTDYLTGARKHASEGELRRLLEMPMATVLTWERHEIETLKTLQNNYGVAGHRYVQWLVQNQATAKDVVQKLYSQLCTEFEASNDERFWMAGVAAMVAGGVLAGSKYANVINLPMVNLKESLRRMVYNARRNIKGSLRTALDVLNDYTSANWAKLILMRRVDGSVKVTYGETGLVDESFSRANVMGRVERNVIPNHTVFYVEEALLKAHCSTMSFGYTDLKAQLEKLYPVKYVKKNLLQGTKGPELRVNAIKIVQPITDVEELLTEE